MDDAHTAEGLMSPAIAGAEVTGVFLDYAVTMHFWIRDRPGASIRLEGPFEIVQPDGSRITVEPGGLKDTARQVAEFHTRTAVDVAVLPANTLCLGFDDGRVILAAFDDHYESWEFGSEDGSRVICTPGGGLAIWGSDSG